MRYTTVIDITEVQAVWRNRNAVVVYTWMAMKCGYHDEDRDMLRVSIRGIGMMLGMTESAVRHSLELLQREKLITRDGEIWRVTKWLPSVAPTPRPKDVKVDHEKVSHRKSIGDKMDEEIQEWKNRVTAALNDMSIEELKQWQDELRDGRSLYHRRVILKSCEQNVRLIQDYINRKQNER
jgi:hypothetical protein